MFLHPDNEDVEETEDGVLEDGETGEVEELVLGDELLPDCAMEDEDVASLNIPYDDRGPTDWVSAGTLDPTYEQRAKKEGLRRMRYFPTWDAAEEWAREHFGNRFKGRIMDAFNSGCPYWAFLVRGPRGANELVR